MHNIALTDYARNNNFTPSFGGTKILDMTPEEFMSRLNSDPSIRVCEAEGYAPFCRHLFVENFTDAMNGVAEITEKNKKLLNTAYEARRPGELEVLVRWFNKEDVLVERARYLDIVLYNKEQLAKENMALAEGQEWGIVAILSAPTPEEAPLNPMTILRNSLGISEGGSGVPLDHAKYKKSVEYWSQWATVR